ncbi:MAG TPA: DUF4268 domain-containing protein [Prolixibacteraceae bacterium]|nr:DUF4268 domain-containing protein [Prolixibacteraceae bacterium]
MYNREEAKQIRVNFWDQFKDYTMKRNRKTGRKGQWILNKTGINGLNLKFHFDNTIAIVGIDVETRNMDKRIDLYGKLESLQKQINKALGKNTQWEIEYTRENNKSISRIYTSLEQVNIFDPECWNSVNMFFYDRMSGLEEFYQEYKDYLRYG